LRNRSLTAARLEATRDLTEKIHRLKVNSSTKMIDAIIQNEALRDNNFCGQCYTVHGPLGGVVIQLQKAMV
jgi:hypothetical protein